jgi:hypothetical protein
VLAGYEPAALGVKPFRYSCEQHDYGEGGDDEERA